MSSMEARRAELEKKKQRLEQLRQERQRKKEERRPLADESSTSDIRSVRSDPSTIDADELLSSLGISLGETASLGGSSMGGGGSSQPSSLEPARPPSVMSSTINLKMQRAAPKLSVCTVPQTNIPPKEHVTYNKTTQTSATNERDGGHSKPVQQPVDYYVLTFDDGEEDGSSLEAKASRHGLPLPPPGTIPGIGGDQPSHPAEPPKKPKVIRELTEDERKQIIMSEDFRVWFDRSSRYVERALSERTDIFIDYTGTGEETEIEDKSGMRVTLNRIFFDDRWSKNRTITSMDWSTQFSELLVCAYNQNEESPHDPDGVVLVWNMKFKKDTPEYVFHCQSPVMSTCFAKFHPNLVIGGLYSGQIVVWDNRSNKRTPVQRSPLSATAHTHPVYSIQVVGSQNAHNLMSMSTDGKLCAWSLDMLAQPQDSLELSKQNKSVAATCMSYAPGEYNAFVVGGEEGALYTACRHGSKAGIIDMLEGHRAPVTSVHNNAAMGPIDFSHLVLSASFDWTVKLWSLKDTKSGCLYSFEDNNDYVYDARWSPIHPALFACVDGMGRLDLWNVNHDTELPTVSATVDTHSALNRCIWTPSGHQVVVGDDQGKTYVYDVGEQLAMPKADDWTKLVHTLQELKNMQSDQDFNTFGTL